MMVTGYSLGDSAIAAIGATNSFYSFVINLSWGLNGGHGIVVAQCFGSHDRERLRSSVAAMLVLNVIGAIILTAASLVALRLAMEFLNTPPEIFDQAYSYIVIVCDGLFTTLFSNALAGFLRAIGNSAAPLWFLLASGFVNLGLDLVLIAEMGFGIQVSALTNVLGQALATLLCARYIWRHHRDLLPQRDNFALDRRPHFDMVTQVSRWRS